MLIMRRRAGESILIGDEIQIHITELGRTRVKIAIDAPRHLAIVAKEVKLIEQENQAAVGGKPADLAALATRFSRAAQNFPQSLHLASDEGSRSDPSGNQ